MHYTVNMVIRTNERPAPRMFEDTMGFHDLLTVRDCACQRCGLVFQERWIREFGQTYMTTFWEPHPTHNWFICWMRRYLKKRGAM